MPHTQYTYCRSSSKREFSDEMKPKKSAPMLLCVGDEKYMGLFVGYGEIQ